MSPNTTAIPQHFQSHAASSPSVHSPQLHLNRPPEKTYSPHGSPESPHCSSVYLSPPAYTEEDYSAQAVSPQAQMSGVRQCSPRFEAENVKKTYTNLTSPHVEGSGMHSEEKAHFSYPSVTTSPHLAEKYNAFPASSSQQWQRGQDAIATRESLGRPSTVIACQTAQRPTIPHANSNLPTGQRGEMGAFEHLRDLLYDDLNRDEFDVYLKKET